MTRLVVRAGGLGDAVLCLPALAELQRRYPDAELQVVGYPAYWAATPYPALSIDRALFAGLFSPTPPPDLLRWLHGVDLLVSWTVSAPHLPIPTVHVSPFPPPGVHAADWLLRSVGGSGDAVPRLELDSVPSSTVFIHPGAGAAWKRWPWYGEIANALRAAGYPVTLIEGPADREGTARMQGPVPFPVVRCPLPDLARMLAGAALVIGNDSGVTHLAAAVGAPTLAIFGPTDPAQWAPRGNVRILRSCDRPGPAGSIRACHDPRCMEKLSPSAVIKAALEMLRDVK